MHLVLKLVDRWQWVLHIKAARIGHTIEIGDRETWVGTIAIHHYRPNKEWEYCLGEQLEVLAEVEYAMVVESDRHTHIMQRWRIALEILDGINVSVEHIRAIENALRLVSATLNKIIVVGIDASYHIATKRLALEEVHQYRLLTTRQINLRWQHHLEIAFIVLKLA